MQVTQYGTYKKTNIDPQMINYIIEDGFECKTIFQGGKSISLSYADLKKLLKKLPRVFSYDLYLPVYVNTKNISFCGDEFIGSITFTDGNVLKNLSGIDLTKIYKKSEDLLNI